jgi:hypothetical protein
MIHIPDTIIKQPPPRRATWKYVEWGCKLNMMFGLAWFIGWGIFMLVKEPPVWDHFILNKYGIPAEARLIHVRRVSITVNKQPVYSIALSFNDRQERPVRANVWSSDPVFIARLNTGRPVTIEYDPGKPSRCRFAGDTIGIMDIVSIIFCVVGPVLFMTSYFSGRSQLQLLRNGVIATARTTLINATSQSRKSGTITIVRYEFTPDGGKPMDGFYKTTEPPEVGQEILIAYDHRRPWRNTPV